MEWNPCLPARSIISKMFIPVCSDLTQQVKGGLLIGKNCEVNDGQCGIPEGSGCAPLISLRVGKKKKEK